VLTGLCVLILGGAAGCKKKDDALDFDRPLPPGAYALRRLVDPEMFPDLAAGCPTDDVSRSLLVTAIDRSLDYLAHPSSETYYPLQGITHAQAVDSLMAFRSLLLAVQPPQELAQQILDRFDVYQSVGCDDRGAVLFTGYYTPIFEGSLEPTGQYRYPLYRLPSDLVKNGEGLCIGRRLDDGRVVPYPARRELETSGQLAGLELVYLKDKFDAYICHVQGSARFRLPDGREFEVGYAGKNAGEYQSVGRLLLADEKIKPEEYSLDAIRRYFREHPGEVDPYCQQNESFIFFQESSGGPFGSLGAPVTPYRSLATDKSVFPRGCLTYVDTTVPVREGPHLIGRPFRAFMLDQDTGGAIRAAGRADIYLGIGDEAGRIAGWTAGVGKLYYLFLKAGAAEPGAAPLP